MIAFSSILFPAAVRATQKELLEIFEYLKCQLLSGESVIGNEVSKYTSRLGLSECARSDCKTSHPDYNIFILVEATCAIAW